MTDSFEIDKNFSKESSDKNGSVFLKSFESGQFNFSELMKKNINISVNFTKTNESIKLSSKSLEKIVLTATEKENLETFCLDYITCTIFENNSELPESADNQDDEVLGAAYYQLFEKTKNFYVSFVTSQLENMRKNLLGYDSNSNKVMINSKTLEKIFAFLETTMFDRPEYINITILYINKEELDKVIIKNKILDKYNQTEDFVVIGTKYFSCSLEVPPKNKENDIKKLDSFFDNVIIHTDIGQKAVLNDSSDNFIFDKPRKFIDKDIVNPTVNENNESNEKCHCGNDMCQGCNIF